MCSIKNKIKKKFLFGLLIITQFVYPSEDNKTSDLNTIYVKLPLAADDKKKLKELEIKSHIPFRPLYYGDKQVYEIIARSPNNELIVKAMRDSNKFLVHLLRDSRIKKEITVDFLLDNILWEEDNILSIQHRHCKPQRYQVDTEKFEINRIS